MAEGMFVPAGLRNPAESLCPGKQRKAAGADSSEPASGVFMRMPG